jgi:pilus assembly protein CpaB
MLSGGGGAPQQTELPPTPTPATINVVVVTQAVARGEKISLDKLGLVPYQEDLVLPDMYLDIEEVEGLLAKYDMDAYTVVTRQLVTEQVIGQGNPAAVLIDRGMVAVSVPISRLSSVSFAPRRGDRVNVIATLLFVDVDTAYQSILPNVVGNVIAPGGGAVITDTVAKSEDVRTLLAQPIFSLAPFGRTETDPLLEQDFYVFPSERQRPRLVSQTLIQNVLVLQIGNFPLEEEEKEPEATPTPGAAEAAPTPAQDEVVEAPKPPDVITLVVTPQDAVALNYLIFSGAQLSLALRSPLDGDVTPTESVTLQFLLDQYNIPIPVKLPYGLEPRIDELIAPFLPNDITPTPEQ